MDRTSLFARKLRAFRAGEGAGAHGRMTQEQLAELLGVSTEAVSKYERSVSYVRGDLEARFIERLGWSSADLANCRADWDAHHLGPRKSSYRVLRGTEAAAHFGSHAAANAAEFELLRAYDSLGPDGFGAPDSFWEMVAREFPDHYHYALKPDGALAGFWAVFPLDAAGAKAFRERSYVEVGASLASLRRMILPGRYFGYCPAVVIRPGCEAAAPLMISAFSSFLEELAARDAFFESIGAIGVSPSGRQLCADLGFDFLGPHRQFPDLAVFEMPARKLIRSIFMRRSKRLYAAYAAEFDGRA